MTRESTPRLPPRDLFLAGGHQKKLHAKVKCFATEVAESPIPSHTDVVADHAQRTNYGMNNVGIGACLDVTA